MASWGPEVQPEELKKGDFVHLRYKDVDSACLFEVKEIKQTLKQTQRQGKDVKQVYVKVFAVRTASGKMISKGIRNQLNQPEDCYDHNTVFYREVRSSPQTRSHESVPFPT